MPKSEIPRPTVTITEAVTRAIAASGKRPEDLIGISAHLCAADDDYPFCWEVAVEPSDMRFFEPHFMRIQVNAETGDISFVEMR